MKWVRTMPFDVYPQTKNVPMSSQKGRVWAASLTPTRPATLVACASALVGSGPVAP